MRISPHTKKGNPGWILLLILAAAFFIRLPLISWLDNRIIYSDEKKNLTLASNLIAGKGYALEDGRPTAVIPAGYPLWLAVLRMLHITDPWHVRMAQILISVLTLLCLYHFSLMLFGNPAALITAAVGAFYPYFIFLPGTILATSLFSLLLVLGTWLYVWAITSNNNKMMFINGIIWGAAVLTVTTAVVLAGATLMWHLRHARASWQKAIRQIAFFSAGALLVLLPWMVRNHHVLGRFTLATNGGYNLWLGNNPASNLAEPCSVPTPLEMDERIIQSGSELYADSLFTATASGFIQAEPWAFIKRSVWKALYFWRLTPSPVTASYIRSSGLVQAASILTFAPILLLACWGYKKAPPHIKSRLILFLYFITAYTAVHAVMIVKVRFRLPMDHFIILLATYGATIIWAEWQKRTNQRMIGCE